ncbi:MAG TPA: AMP-binding protein [Actinomycetota bacterium]|nr:AMP-binding protein [Actinomycetota bacterium]
MPDILDLHAQANPDKVALIHGDKTWTFAEHNARANALARGIRSLGIAPGDKGVWVGPNHEKVVLWGHAARKAQLISVPLSYRFTPVEMEYILTNSDATVVFCDPDSLETMQSIRPPNVREIVDYQRAEQLIAANSGDALEELEQAESLGSSMIYTSGTTGKPKGALRSGNDPALVAILVREIRYSSDDVHITTGPLYHSGPLGFSGLTHALGGTIVILPKFDALEWLRLVDEHKVTATFTAPTQLKRIVNLPEEIRSRYETSSLRSVIANAAPVPFALKKQWIETFGEGHLFEVYGSTELGVDTIIKPEDQLRKPGSCGTPWGGIEIRLIREDGTDAPIGEPGVMWIRSPGTFDEYYKAPEKTEETKLEDDPSWRTVGDIAYRDDEGFYYICDRRSDMIISGGMNIYPAEIEAVLHSHPAVMDAGVFGIPSEEWGEHVHAVVQLKEGSSVSTEELDALCREHLAGYKVPRSFEFRDQLPRTESGKLSKKKLRDEFWKDQASRV